MKEHVDKTRASQNILDKIGTGYVVCSLIDQTNLNTCQYLELNREFERISGLARDCILGKTVNEAIPFGLDSDWWQDFCVKACLNQEPGERLHFDEGKNRWYKLKSCPLEGALGLIYVTDVTEYRSLIDSLQSELDKYKFLFDNEVSGIFIIQKGKVRFVNEIALNLFGYSFEDLSNIPLTDLIYLEDKTEVLKNYLKIRDAKKKPFSFRIQTKKHKLRWVELKAINIQWQGEAAILNFINDITEQKRAIDALRESEEKYRLLTENTSDVIWVYNLTRERFTYMSPSILFLRGITPEEALEEALEDCFLPENCREFRNSLKKYAKEFLRKPDEPQNYIYEVLQPTKNKDLKWIEMSFKFRLGFNGQIEVVGVSRDIESRKQAEKSILNLSYNDQLTGLYNRRYYEAELHRLDNLRNLPISLIMADVNGLKMINDAFGHQEGDKLLIRVAEIIKDNSRIDDIAVRIGGDEFVILLPKTSYEEAQVIVGRIQDAIAKEKDAPALISVSFGWATKTSLYQGINQIYKDAEDAMYRRKLSEGSIMRSETIKTVVKTLYQKSQEEQAHGQRVSVKCKAMALALNMNENDVEEMVTLGLLHDIGKIGINEYLLEKNGVLNDNEWQEVKRHPEIGYQILKATNEFSGIANFVLCHHEKLDGTGYPRGISGDEIPMQSRIISIVDAYDSMTNGRPHKKRMDESQAVQELILNAGVQFDEGLVKVFVEQVLGRQWHDLQAG